MFDVHHANADAVDDDGWTAMTHAAENGHNYREMLMDDEELFRMRDGVRRRDFPPARY